MNDFTLAPRCRRRTPRRGVAAGLIVWRVSVLVGPCALWVWRRRAAALGVA